MTNTRQKSIFIRMLSFLLAFVIMFSALNITVLATGTGDGDGPPDATQGEGGGEGGDGSGEGGDGSGGGGEPDSDPPTPAPRSAAHTIDIDYEHALKNATAAFVNPYATLPADDTLTVDAATGKVTFTPTALAENTALIADLNGDGTNDATKLDLLFDRQADEAAIAQSEGTVANAGDLLKQGDIYYVSGATYQYIYKFVGYRVITEADYNAMSPSTQAYVDSNDVTTRFSGYLDVQKFSTGTVGSVAGYSGTFVPDGMSMELDANSGTWAKVYPVFLSVFPVYSTKQTVKHSIPDEHFTDGIHETNIYTRFYIMNIPIGEPGYDTIGFNPEDLGNVAQQGNPETSFADFNQTQGALISENAEIYTWASPIVVSNPVLGTQVVDLQKADVIDEVLKYPTEDRPTDEEAIQAFNDEFGYTQADDSDPDEDNLNEWLDPTKFGVFWYVAKVEQDGYHIDGVIYEKAKIGTDVKVNYYDVDGSLLFTETVKYLGDAQASALYYDESHNDATTYTSQATYESRYPTNDASNPRLYTFTDNYENKDGYEFLGWYTTSQAQGGGNEILVTALDQIAAEVNLYARVGVELQYNSNVTNHGGTAGSDVTYADPNNAYAMGANATVSTFASIETASALFDAPAGYVFSHWSTEPSGGTKYLEGATYTMPNLPTDAAGAIDGTRTNWTGAPVTLYAQYIQEFTVKYDENLDEKFDDTITVAGDEIVDDPNSPYVAGTQVTVLPTSETLFATFEKAGHELVGWEWRYTENGNHVVKSYNTAGYELDANGVATTNNKFEMPSANVILHAVYEANLFTVTAEDLTVIYNNGHHNVLPGGPVDKNGASVDSTITYEYSTDGGSTYIEKIPFAMSVGVYHVRVTATAKDPTLYANPNGTATDIATVTVLPRPVAVQIADDDKTYRDDDPNPFALEKTGRFLTVTDLTSSYAQVVTSPETKEEYDYSAIALNSAVRTTYTTLPSSNVTLEQQLTWYTVVGQNTIVRSNASENNVRVDSNGNVIAYDGVLIQENLHDIYADNANFIIVDAYPGNFTINPLPITVTAADVSVPQGVLMSDSLYSGQVKVESIEKTGVPGIYDMPDSDEALFNFVSDENKSDTYVQGLINAGTDETGLYDISYDQTATNTALNNYIVTLVSGDLVVGNAAFVVRDTDVNIMFNGVDHEAFAEVVWAQGQSQGTRTVTIEYKLPTETTWSVDRPSSIDVINQDYDYRVTVSGFTPVLGTVNVTVTPRPISATPVDDSKTYGDSDPTLGFGTLTTSYGLQSAIIDNPSNTSVMDPTTWQNDIPAMGVYVERVVSSPTPTNPLDVKGLDFYADTYSNVLVAKIAIPNSNYVFTGNTADFTINPRLIRFTAGDYGKTYGQDDADSVLLATQQVNGFVETPVGPFGYMITAGSVADGDGDGTDDGYGAVTVTRTNAATQNDAGTYRNVIVPSIDQVNYTGHFNTTNYTVDTVAGLFTISQKDLTITVLDYEKFYATLDDVSTLSTLNVTGEKDATHNTHFGYTVAGLENGDEISLNIVRNGLTPGARVEEDVLRDAQGNVAAYADVLTVEQGTIVIANAANPTASKLGNYNIVSQTPGNFTIKPLVIELTAEDFFKTYGYTDSTSQLITANANAVAATNGTWAYEVTSGTPANNAQLGIADTLEVNVTRTNAPGQPGFTNLHTDANTTANPIYTGVLVPTATLVDANGVDVTGNYTINTTPGDFRVDPRPITLTATGFTKLNTAIDPPVNSYVSSGSLVTQGDLGTLGAQRVSWFVGDPVGSHNGVIEPLYTANSNYVVTLINGDVVITEAAAPPVPPVPPTPPTPPEPPTPPTPEPPTPEVPDEPIIDLPETEPPLVDTIEETELPLASGAAWALLNLILTIVTSFITIVLLINYFAKKKDETESEQQREMEKAETEDEKQEVKNRGVMRLISIIPAVVAIIVFILTEDMTLPMTIVDDWTWLMAAIAIAQVVVATLSKKNVKYSDEDQDFDAENFA